MLGWQAAARKQAEVSHRGHYTVRVDAANVIDPYDSDVSRSPELVSIIMQDSVQMPISSDTSTNLGCTCAQLANCLLHALRFT